ncbi:prepilin-type N-terminal cleavage/methylation domain-containing protein [bacterium]|nr:prepilin-type N-terminal cleavage/methylation domain-containing protein [bacterium]
MQSGFKKSGGFSLLELLVALTILVIALLPIAYFYGRMLANVEQASIRTRAVGLANERIAELEQMPVEMLRANNSPQKGDIINPSLNITGAVWGETAPLDMEADNFYFDPGPPYRTYQYYYALPVEFNPYNPFTQGWNNTPGVDHYDPDLPEFEYEPIGFMARLARSTDIAETDPRLNPAVGTAQAGSGGYIHRTSGIMHFQRTGSESREELYDIYGRRTVIMEVVPEPADDDGDSLLPDDPLDGGATTYDPYPLLRGPANKFQVRSKDGAYGFQGWVTVFWLPADAPERYVPLEGLSYIQVPFFISATNADSTLAVGDSKVIVTNKFVIS